MGNKTTFCVIAFFSIILSTNFAEAQKYGNIWHFGYGFGLDFNTCKPKIILGENIGLESCSTISDENGSLLFYTNSDSVWNKNHEVMPNGFLNFTDGSLSQVIIIPKPSNPDIYYIITPEILAKDSLYLQSHTVDMSLNGGNGDVFSKNNVLSNLNLTEQIAASYHSNGTDIWLVAHEYGTNNFLSFLVTATGISSTPIISSVGPSHLPCTNNVNARGEIRFSPNGERLALSGNGVGASPETNLLTLFDFDNTSGLVSNPFNLPFSQGEYGLSFSPDNSKLYGSTWKFSGFQSSEENYLYQFDLSSGDSSIIVNSKVIIDSISIPQNFGTLKIGPDAKLYVRMGESDYMSVIASPNLPGDSCDFQKNQIYIGHSHGQNGLNHSIEWNENCSSNVAVNELDADIKLTIYPNPARDFVVLSADKLLQSYQLFDVNGQLVSSAEGLHSSEVRVDISTLEQGLYLIKVEDVNGGLIVNYLIVNG